MVHLSLLKEMVVIVLEVTTTAFIYMVEFNRLAFNIFSKNVTNVIIASNITEVPKRSMFRSIHFNHRILARFNPFTIVLQLLRSQAGSAEINNTFFTSTTTHNHKDVIAARENL